MLASKSTMPGDDVTTEKMPGKRLPGGGNNAKANEWSFYGIAYWKQSVSRYRSVSLAFSVLYIFGPRATLSSFMPAWQSIFVRDTLGLVLGECCKVHSVTKQAWLHITVGIFS